MQKFGGLFLQGNPRVKKLEKKYYCFSFQLEIQKSS